MKHAALVCMIYLALTTTVAFGQNRSIRITPINRSATPSSSSSSNSSQRTTTTVLPSGKPVSSSSSSSGSSSIRIQTGSLYNYPHRISTTNPPSRSYRYDRNDRNDSERNSSRSLRTGASTLSGSGASLYNYPHRITPTIPPSSSFGQSPAGRSQSFRRPTDSTPSIEPERLPYYDNYGRYGPYGYGSYGSYRSNGYPYFSDCYPSVSPFFYGPFALFDYGSRAYSYGYESPFFGSDPMLDYLGRLYRVPDSRAKSKSLLATFEKLRVEFWPASESSTGEEAELRLEWTGELEDVHEVDFFVSDKEEKPIVTKVLREAPYLADFVMKPEVSAVGMTVRFKSGAEETMRVPLATVMQKLKPRTEEAR